MLFKICLDAYYSDNATWYAKYDVLNLKLQIFALFFSRDDLYK